MRYFPLVVLVVGCCYQVCRADDDTALKELQGNWRVAAAEREGTEVPRIVWEGAHWKFDGNTMIPGHGFAVASVKLDASQDPKQIDRTDAEGEHKGKAALGIYRLEQDRLTVRFRDPGDTDRPKDFKTERADRSSLWVLERVRE